MQKVRTCIIEEWSFCDIIFFDHAGYILVENKIFYLIIFELFILMFCFICKTTFENSEVLGIQLSLTVSPVLILI